MIVDALTRLGFRGWHLRTGSIAAMMVCVGLWLRAKTVDQDERGNSERRALFIGLWPPTLWLMGDTLERHLLARRSLRRRRPWA